MTSGKVRPRATVVETLYHQQPGGQPTSVVGRFSRPLASDEEPYRRRVKIGPAWKPLDRGWVGAASMAWIENAEGRFSVNPTPAELAAALARAVELAVQAGGEPVPFARVLPGESFRWPPADLSLVRVRCLSGEASCNLVLVPA